MVFQGTDPYLHCVIGGKMDIDQTPNRLVNCWLGQLGGIYFFNDTLPPEQAKVSRIP
jgi:hypothetical protein